MPPSLHVLGNALEAALWSLIALVLFIASCPYPQNRKPFLIASLAFLLFGLSDLVEISTGAWWRPWWLLLWKAACLGTFLTLWLNHRRKSKP